MRHPVHASHHEAKVAAASVIYSVVVVTSTSFSGVFLLVEPEKILGSEKFK